MVCYVTPRDTHGLVVSSPVSGNTSWTALTHTWCVVVVSAYWLRGSVYLVLLSCMFQVVFHMCFRCYDSDYLLIPMIVVLGFMTHTIVLAALQSQHVSVYKLLVVKTKHSSLVFLTIIANTSLTLYRSLLFTSNQEVVFEGSTSPCIWSRCYQVVVLLWWEWHWACLCTALVPQG